MKIAQALAVISTSCVFASACGSHQKNKKNLTYTEDKEEKNRPKSDNSNRSSTPPITDGSNVPLVKNDTALLGDWSTDCVPPNADSAHHTKVVRRFSDSSVTTAATLYDDDCRSENLAIILTFTSSYTAGSASALGHQVKNIDYRFEKVFISLHTEGEVLQSNLQNNGRGRCLVQWQLGKPIEVSALSGAQRQMCGGRVSVPTNGKQLFDIYQMKAGELRFGLTADHQPTQGEGEQPNQRPGELADYVYRKVTK